MYNYNSWQCLPSSAELPDSDDTPVDSELQILIPNLLLAVLSAIWSERDDWYFGINMGVYYEPNQEAIVPDGFLSLGVERFVGEHGRSSYVLWEEENIPPIFALEIVSQTYNGEYEQKKMNYADLGVLYYAIYAPTRLRRKRQRLEIYRRVEGEYVLQAGDQPNHQIWMPEVGLGLGREVGTYQGKTREWLFWYDEAGQRYQTPEEQLQTLRAKLHQQGIDPNSL
ncbi:MAG: Uma2 family endonuclease [Oscillatoriales cyanobacterium RM1_1_9]|nr:Uma2 family endonuclease [Oscillatoriales cyanobacterium SM2_3_0]NJO71753.1 Uma2 family endonuclease [Oscillatoriales cyanobacterium RM1_1_9]